MEIRVRLGLAGNVNHFGRQKGDVVTIPFEDYVKGVVAAEIGNSDLEACKAQAVAARTFAYLDAKNGKVVGDTANDGQVFFAARMGNRGSYLNALVGVEATRGEVMTYQGKDIGRNAHFSSANNGTTKNKSYKWPFSADLPYLVMRPDPWTQGELAAYKAAGRTPKFGHGVGLSQYGVRYAAGIGIGYREMLNFYYPGTVIVNYEGEGDQVEEVKGLTNGQKIIEFSRSQVGEPYELKGRGPDVWDCSGLTLKAAREIGLTFFHGATTQWNRGRGIIDGAVGGNLHWVGYFSAYGEIGTAPKNKVLQLFNRSKDNPSKMAHTGWYDPVTGNVIQAGGYGGRGVHENPVLWDRWTHWATIKGAEEEYAMSNDLRIGSVGESVRELQQSLMKLGYDVGKNTRADGKFGPATEAGVRAFQADYLLPATGIWGDADARTLAAALNEDDPLPFEPDDFIDYLLRAREDALALAASIDAYLEARA